MGTTVECRGILPPRSGRVLLKISNMKERTNAVAGSATGKNETPYTPTYTPTIGGLQIMIDELEDSYMTGGITPDEMNGALYDYVNGRYNYFKL